MRSSALAVVHSQGKKAMERSNFAPRHKAFAKFASCTSPLFIVLIQRVRGSAARGRSYVHQVHKTFSKTSGHATVLSAPWSMVAPSPGGEDIGGASGGVGLKRQTVLRSLMRALLRGASAADTLLR